MERYIYSPYFQHFCDEIYFQYDYPSDPSDFVHFRRRIGEEGMEMIFKQSIVLCGKERIRIEVKEVSVDSHINSISDKFQALASTMSLIVCEDEKKISIL